MQDETRGSLRLIGVAFFIFFFGFLLLAAPFWWQQWKVLHTWPAVDAEVIQSDVVPVTVKGKTAYDVFLAFRFKLADRVLDTTYRSNDLAASPERKRAEADRFPVGKHVQVLYEPGNPTKLRLDPGYNLRFFAIPAVISTLGIMCGLIGCGFLIAAGRKSPTPASPPQGP
jgi:Protein of unknown function (DUF3592)